MAHDPSWVRAVPKARANGAACVARMVFVVGMGAAVWMAITRLPLRPALALGASVTTGLALADALSGANGETVLASILLCVLLAITAHSMRRGSLPLRIFSATI